MIQVVIGHTFSYTKKGGQILNIVIMVRLLDIKNLEESDFLYVFILYMTVADPGCGECPPPPLDPPLYELIDMPLPSEPVS